MRILIVGASGPIGRAVVEELSNHHQIVKAGRSHGDLRVDIRNRESVSRLFREVGMLDAIVCAAGHVHFDALDKMNFEKFQVGLQDKLMGQVNLVLAGQSSLNDGGSFTLTSGSTSEIPIRNGTSESMVDGAVETFVRAAAIELSRGLRINAVSPTILEESMEAYGHYFPGYEAVPRRKHASDNLSNMRVPEADSSSYEWQQSRGGKESCRNYHQSDCTWSCNLRADISQLNTATSSLKVPYAPRYGKNKSLDSRFDASR
jgi:NAD(P)-dependent dehydrogenase (short-subunit alcohol dehydrogenase family)